MHEIKDTPLHRPLSLLYGAGVGLRAFAYDHGLLPSRPGVLPSICLGNVVVGGSGKTPFTQFLALALLERGYSPAVLLRGYGGKYTTPQLLTASSLPSEVGDEAALHRLTLPPEIPVAVAKDRLFGIAMIQKESSANVVLLDDGLQHRKLRCEANILLLNASSSEAVSRWKHGRLLPAGYLREPLHSVLQRTNYIIYSTRRARLGKETQPALAKEVLDSSFTSSEGLPIPSACFTMQPSHFVDLYSGQSIGIEELRRQECEAASAIADPQQFFADLTTLGLTLSSTQAFPDHHQFTEAQRDSLLSARKTPLLITEKDAVKLRHSVREANQVFMLVTRGLFTSLREDSANEETAFWEFLIERLSKRISLQ